MTEQNRLALGEPALVAEPRRNFFAGDSIGDWCGTLTDEVQLSLARAVAHTRQVVGDDAQAGDAA